MTSSAESLSRLEAALADRYAIERELGRGGAAIVYLARDLKHGRRVALKVLRSDVAASLGADRFLREIEIAARLSHPHILPLHDSGAVDGFLYYVMPYVEGESLRTRLERERQLPVDDAVRIAREVASALAYAHGQHVVHRDVKPENILLFAGEAMVADFGIARAMVAAGGASLTDTGLVMGTPAYMSPEQTGERGELDGRSDQYALGCVVYEMLAGAPPFSGTTAQQVMARHAVDPVPPLRTIRPDLADSVAGAVRRALAKTPADRFPTVAAFAEALRQSAPAARRRMRRTWLIAGGVAAALTGLVFIIRQRSPAQAAGAASVPSIAVLPFTNVGGDSTNAPFSDGMADELTTALGKVDGLSVAARTSAFNLRKKGLSAQEIGAQLHVRYLVDGAVRKAENRRRVSAELIDAASGKELWSGLFEHDARVGDVFTVQDSITRAIVAALRVKFSGATTGLLSKRSTESPEAHDLYLQGRYFFDKRDSASLRKAEEYFERAIQKDSGYALAYAGLSDAYSHSSAFGYAAPRDVFPRAKVAAAKALALDSTSVEARTSEAFISVFYDWDWPRAKREFDVALALNPRYSPAHLYRAWYFVATDQIDAAVDAARTAVKLDPFSSVNNVRLATMLFFARRYADALDQGHRLAELDPTFFQVHAELGRAYLGMNRCAEALAELEQPPAHLATLFRAALGYTYARCGRRAEALSEVRRLEGEAKAGHYVSPYAFAMIHAGLGDKDRAFAELDSAYAERATTMFHLKVEPAFDQIRSDPRFTRLMNRLGLAQ